jgi:hypothetical protein
MNDHMIGYIALRRLIGIVGLLFPFILMIAYKIMNQGPLPGSISDYYYANEVCQSILVGSLCLIGGFLFTYRGYDKDYIPVRLASIFAIGVAFFPTIPNNPSSFNNLIGIFHGAFAGLMFFSLAIISLFVFTRTENRKSWNMTKRKKQRNIIYRTCGIIMLGAMVLIPVLIHIPLLKPLHPMYWLETIVVFFFSISWLIKGETILRDKK